ncbi:hypothetical protein ACVW1C_007579 [Bradyrhizobium sp. USDA 4011]
MTAAETDPARQGELLRRALADHVRSAQSSERIRWGGLRGFIDIDELIGQYIPEGSSFDTAEGVLRSAGFTLDPRPSPDVAPRFPGSEEEFDVQVGLGYGRDHFEGGAQCAVSLRPKRPYDYSVVFRVVTNCMFLTK